MTDREQRIDNAAFIIFVLLGLFVFGPVAVEQRASERARRRKAKPADDVTQFMWPLERY